VRTLRKPRAHQKEGLAACAGHEAFAFLMAMRTGKTWLTLADYVRMHRTGTVGDLAVIAPGGVYETWAGAIPLEIGEPPEIHVWHSGGSAKEVRRRKEFLAGESGRPRALIMNVEALSIPTTGAREMMSRFLRQSPVYLAIDESTSIKNPRAKRTKFIVDKLGPEAAVRRILTGLVSPRSPLDVYSQFAFLDPRIIGHRSYFTFRARYGVLKLNYFAGRKVITVEGYQNLEELRGLTAPYSFRRTLEDCYDMPPSTYQVRHVRMTEEQEAAYADMRDYATTMLAGLSHVTATIVIVQMLKLHQILCGHVKDEGGAVREVAENRTRALLETLEEHEGKAIVWCSYGHSIDKVSRAIEVGLSKKGKKVGSRKLTDEEGITDPVNRGFGEGSVARFWGGNRKDREAEEHRFKTDPRCRFMVATPDAGGKGRTWDVADLVVYYSSTNNLEFRSQSEERPKGVGKTKSIGYVDLITPGTVEEKFLAALRTKMDLAAQVTGDAWREWIV